MKTKRYIHEMILSQDRLSLTKSLPHAEGRGARVHILALGDVGATLLLGLKVLGAGTIDTIGIYDVNPNVLERYEREMNQMGWAFEEAEAEEGGTAPLPKVVILKEEELFNCDLFLFCASKAIPAIGVKGDVRMMQFEANRKIVEHFASMAGAADYKGIFGVVSDP
ncbi:MAG: lactate dehydrogenase, partial [Firmicutes bacterium]|nr:lactate dehydrogenase [Bacillota bacterium]